MKWKYSSAAIVDDIVLLQYFETWWLKKLIKANTGIWVYARL